MPNTDSTLPAWDESWIDYPATIRWTDQPKKRATPREYDDAAEYGDILADRWEQDHWRNNGG